MTAAPPSLRTPLVTLRVAPAPVPVRTALIDLRVRPAPEAPPTAPIPIPTPTPTPPPAPAPSPKATRPRRLRPALGQAGRLLSPAVPIVLALVALGLLPLAAARTPLQEIGGLGLAGVLSPWGWAALGAAVLACAVEILRARPRPALLVGLTGVLILSSTGLPALLEPAARLPTAWTHIGFVESIAGSGQLPANIDARFSWAGFFTHWAWLSDAAGGLSFDGIVRWAPLVIVAVWALGTYSIAESLLGGSRAPWAAAWLMLGVNWIEQDYFSPQATAIVLSLAVLGIVLGPLGAERDDPAGGRWLRSYPSDRFRRLGRLGRLGRPDQQGRHSRPSALRRALVAASTPVRRPPALGGGSTVLLWLSVVLCVAAIAVDHQLTPFALGWQLLILAVAGRFWGRWLVAVLFLLQGTWFVLGAAEFWHSQLGLATNDVGNVGGSLISALFGRLVGDAGQLVAKLGRIGLALATWGLALAGAWIRWRRDRTWLLVPLAAAPVGLVLVQSYGGEILMRVMLYGMPFLAVLGAEVLRSTAVRFPRLGRPVLVVGMAALFATLVLLRGGNDAYVQVTPHDVAVTREVLAAAPAGDKVLPLANEGPNRVTRAGDVIQITSVAGCQAIADDPAGCAQKERPYAIVALPSMEAEGIWLDGRAPGWSRVAVNQIVATGQYRITRDEGTTIVLERVGPK